MAASSRIVELSSAIHSNTAIVDEYLTSNALPPLSFGVDSPLKMDFPDSIAAAKMAVLEAMDELKALMLGPVPMIVDDVAHNVCSFVLPAFGNILESY